MQAKTERFEMRLDPGTLEEVDAWREDQEDAPSRSEAVRRLVEAGLSTTSAKRSVSLSDGEKLILLMLCDLFKHLKVESDTEPRFIEKVIFGGHYWGLKWKYHGIFHGHVDKHHALTEVVDILDMWSFIESGYSKLSKKDKERVEKEAAPFGKDPKFRGFDGNNESEHIGIANFLIEDMGRFSTFEGRYLNSHMPSIETYRRMLKSWQPMRRSLMGGELTASQISELLKEKTHPDYRGGSVTAKPS